MAKIIITIILIDIEIAIIKLLLHYYYVVALAEVDALFVSFAPL